MDLEQWNLAINNASNLWIAGMMTIQTLLIAFTLWIGFRQYQTFTKQFVHPFADKAKKINNKINKFHLKIYARGVKINEIYLKSPEWGLYPENRYTTPTAYIFHVMEKSNHFTIELNKLYEKLRLNLEKISEKRLSEIVSKKIEILNDYNFELEHFFNYYINVSESLSIGEDDVFGKEFHERLKQFPYSFNDRRGSAFNQYWKLDEEFNSILSSYIRIEN